jgi:hypothetical protein
MVQRAKLTPRFVFEASCPSEGELWIADTEIRGFGLRLWSNKSGGQKAFAIRVSDLYSRKIRRTFDLQHARRTLSEFAYSGRENRYGLGEYLAEAREWARNEIDTIKGQWTIHDEWWAGHRTVARLVRTMTLQRAATALLEGLRADNASESYLDRLDKLFVQYVPEKLKCTPLDKLNPKQAARIIVNTKASAGNLRVLRSFISQIIERGASFDARLRCFQDDFAEEFSYQWLRKRKVRYPELNKRRDKSYHAIFHALESDQEFWQQAFAIRLYFSFHVPLSRVLAGQWKQIHEQHWYPYWPDEKEYWFECREPIGKEVQTLLDKIEFLSRRDFGNSQFWFPSRHRHGDDPIRTVEHAWRRALRKSHVPYYPLREFSRSFREFNNPSYYISFLRQYGTIFREMQNVAEVSKKLVLQKMSQ